MAWTDSKGFYRACVGLPGISYAFCTQDFLGISHLSEDMTPFRMLPYQAPLRAGLWLSETPIKVPGVALEELEDARCYEEAEEARRLQTLPSYQGQIGTSTSRVTVSLHAILAESDVHWMVYGTPKPSLCPIHPPCL